MSINSLYYTALTAKITSVLSLVVFFFSYWKDLENRLLILCLGLSLTGWIVGQLFEAYFLHVVTKITIAKHIAQQNMLEEVMKEEARDVAKEITHPLFDTDNERKDNE